MNQKSSGLIEVQNELFETYEAELDIPVETLLRANELLDNAVEDGLTRSRCYRTLTAAVALLACREQNVPRVADDFATVTIKNGTSLDTIAVARESRRLKRELKLHIVPTDRQAYLEYYADELNVTEETREKALELLDSPLSQDLATHASPTSIAAGALDAARRYTDDDIVQSDIATISHVSIPQFREYCHQFMGDQNTPQASQTA